MSTIDSMIGAKDILQNEILGSSVTLGAFMLIFLTGLMIRSRVNMKVGLVAMLPGILAIVGGSTVGSFLGDSYAWIGVVSIIGVSFVYGIIWWRVARGA